MDKNIFNNYLSKLVDESFVFIPDWGKWEKQKENRIERLNISYREYSGNYYVEGMSSSIIFSDVEDILNEILNKYNIQQRYGDKTIRHSLHNIEGIDYSKFEAKIHDESSFQVVAEEIKKIVEYGAMPFFEKYQTLEKIHNHAKQLSLDEYSQFFSGYGSFKMMIIKRLLKINDYEDYSKKIVQDWIRTAREYPQHFMNIDKVVVELKDVLDKL
jgi:hypothetical protein